MKLYGSKRGGYLICRQADWKALIASLKWGKMSKWFSDSLAKRKERWKWIAIKIMSIRSPRARQNNEIKIEKKKNCRSTRASPQNIQFDVYDNLRQHFLTKQSDIRAWFVTVILLAKNLYNYFQSNNVLIHERVIWKYCRKSKYVSINAASAKKAHHR